MHVDRLERMERCLRVYAENEFNRIECVMLWHQPSSCDFIFNLNVWSSYLEIDGTRVCGTTGCAIGLAMHQNLFKAEGLLDSAVGPILEMDDGHLYQGFEAICHLFGLTQVQAAYLFSPQLHFTLDKPLYGPEAALACADRICELLDTVEVKPVEVEVVKLVRVLEPA
jgi:hypothetical protein